MDLDVLPVRAHAAHLPNDPTNIFLSLLLILRSDLDDNQLESLSFGLRNLTQLQEL
jgi:hypothetical protein